MNRSVSPPGGSKTVWGNATDNSNLSSSRNTGQGWGATSKPPQETSDNAAGTSANSNYRLTGGPNTKTKPSWGAAKMSPSGSTERALNARSPSTVNTRRWGADTVNSNQNSGDQMSGRSTSCKLPFVSADNGPQFHKDQLQFQC